jgi:ribose transport system ATP-binding protein
MDSGLYLSTVSKHFGGLRALDQVDLSVEAGEVLALLGQNGSGKSTLVKIMTGVHSPDPGATMEIWGRRVDFPITAPHEHGIAVIHQDLGLVDTMTVLENIGVTSSFGQRPRTRTTFVARALAPISFRTERDICRALLSELGLEIGPDRLVADLSPAERAMVAIARAKRVLQEHAQRFVFVLDEPTAYLSADESDRVMHLMRSVAEGGNAVIFISHRLHEALQIADRITVLRDGQVSDTFRAGEGDQSRILAAMLGRRLAQTYPGRPARADAPPTLVVDGLVGHSVERVSFEASPGEIVGFAGLVGMGHEDIPYLVAHAKDATTGRITFNGIDLRARTAGEVIDLGVSLVPGNRQRDGVWPEARASENLALLGNRRSGLLSRLRLGHERRHARAAMERFGVRPPDPDQRVSAFSGGNQQKIVLAKWMADDPALLLLDEPTQGIDAGAKFEVLEMLCGAAQAGAVVLISSGDYEQLAHICHRVLVLRFGRVVAELTGDRISEAAITQLAQAGGLTTPDAQSKGRP